MAIKKTLYRLINRLGYRIEKKRSWKHQLRQLNQYDVVYNEYLLYKCSSYLDKISTAYEDLAVSDKDDGLLVEFDGVQFYIETAEEAFIIVEVFVNECYNFNLNKKSVIIDIGANIGISSVYFSRSSLTDTVYSFEPIDDTFNQALMNLSFNSSTISKVIIENYGLADKEGTSKFLYNKKHKGNTGVRGLDSPMLKTYSDNEFKTVKLEQASTVFEEIISHHRQSQFVVKMDCEGSEYSILEDLDKADLLKHLSLIMIEWHDKGAATLNEILSRHNFATVSSNLSPHAGLIYAFNNELFSS